MFRRHYATKSVVVLCCPAWTHLDLQTRAGTLECRRESLFQHRDMFRLELLQDSTWQLRTGRDKTFFLRWLFNLTVINLLLVLAHCTPDQNWQEVDTLQGTMCGIGFQVATHACMITPVPGLRSLSPSKDTLHSNASTSGQHWPLGHQTHWISSLNGSRNFTYIPTRIVVLILYSYCSLFLPYPYFAYRVQDLLISQRIK